MMSMTQPANYNYNWLAVVDENKTTDYYAMYIRYCIQYQYEHKDDALLTKLMEYKLYDKHCTIQQIYSLKLNYFQR